MQLEKTLLSSVVDYPARSTCIQGILTPEYRIWTILKCGIMKNRKGNGSKKRSACFCYMTSAVKERLVHFDIAKGMAMIMIILTHLDNAFLSNATMAAHIPVFYFISGYFLSGRRSLLETAKNKFHALVIPYLWIAGIYLFLFVCNQIRIGNPNWIQSSLQALAGAAYGAGNNITQPLPVPKIGAIWYLLANFWGLLLVRWAMDHLPGGLLVCLALAVLAVETTGFCWLPFSLQAGAVASLYIFAGWFCRQSPLLDLRKFAVHTPSFWISLLLCAVVWVVCTLHFDGFYLVESLYKSSLMNFLSSWCILYATLALAWLLVHWQTPVLLPFFGWVGQHSLIVLGVHFLELRLLPWWIWISRIPFFAAHAHWSLLAVFVCKLLLDLGLTACFLVVRSKIRLLVLHP